VKGDRDRLISENKLCINIRDWTAYLREDFEEAENELIRKYTQTGRPSEDDELVNEIERKLHRSIRKKKPGPKRYEKPVTLVSKK
jgi:hypothetical protein